MQRLAQFLALTFILATSGVCPAQTPSEGEQQFANFGVCKLVSGRQIEACRIGYRTYGKLNADRSNAVLFPSWFSGTSGDLRESVGAQGLVDPTGYFVILVDALGDGVSSSPSNSATQHGPDFPAITVHDMVNAEYRLATETLHLTHLRAVMGISMGGLQTFEWVVDYPDFMDVAVPIVGTPRPNSFDLLIYRAITDAIQMDPAWKQGRYTTPPPVSAAMDIMQMQLTSPAHFARTHPLEKFGEEDAQMREKGILPADANDWLAQMDAIIHHDIARGGSMEDAARHVKAHMLIVTAAQDHLVSPKPALDFAALIGAKTLVLDSDCGHRSRVCEASTLDPAVRAFLDGQ